ncbi:hypothetical protein AWC06_20970 [Mycobacterium fragae]|uniref:Uncharacterized protein n=1 Tax=Mycobacterium fragae TaxID=1260918 RepID=A0A1X1UMC4_9MYCO|nr:hypothetical protein AWC06_20970 [Mycobacterium fragae]
MARQHDFLNSLDTFCATAKTFADRVEGAAAFWKGQARMAAYNTGIDLHGRLKDVHAWGMTLVQNVGQNVSVMHNSDLDSAQSFNALGGGDTAIST